MGKLVRNSKGQFVVGTSGHGRPKGSKNLITYQKLMVEEAFRNDQADDIAKVLALVVKQAKDGDKHSQKLVWDAAVSRQTLAEDKAAGNKQNITVKTMNVHQEDIIEGDFIDETEPEETIQ